MGTNFVVGRKYMITYCDGMTSALTLNGATTISATNGDYRGTTIAHGLFVEATSSTISIPTSSYHSSVVYPYEFT